MVLDLSSSIAIGIVSSLSTALLLAIAAFLARNLFIERLRLSLQKEHTRFLDELQWNRKVQAQAERVAEYLALARRLKEESPESDYERADQLSWELAMWLPAEVYRQTTRAIATPSESENALTVIIAVRKVLLGNRAGQLVADDIAHHAPGIGKQSSGGQ
jgi:hypothetical protein